MSMFRNLHSGCHMAVRLFLAVNLYQFVFNVWFQKSSGGALKVSKVKSPKAKSSALTTPPPTPEKTIESLLPEATAQEVTQWLHHNRFSHYVKVFQNFAGACRDLYVYVMRDVIAYNSFVSCGCMKHMAGVTSYLLYAGADLLRLSRDDLIQICGLADGIRLNNALQSKHVRPKLTIYVCQTKSRKSRATQADDLPVRLPKSRKLHAKNVMLHRLDLIQWAQKKELVAGIAESVNTNE